MSKVPKSQKRPPKSHFWPIRLPIEIPLTQSSDYDHFWGQKSIKTGKKHVFTVFTKCTSQKIDPPFIMSQNEKSAKNRIWPLLTSKTPSTKLHVTFSILVYYTQKFKHPQNIQIQIWCFSNLMDGGSIFCIFSWFLGFGAKNFASDQSCELYGRLNKAQKSHFSPK